MKKLMIAAIVGAFAFSAPPALASGKGGGVKVGAGITTGKGGLVGALLGGGHGRGNNGVGVQLGVVTGKKGVLGLLLGGGGGHGRHGGCGC